MKATLLALFLVTGCAALPRYSIEFIGPRKRVEACRFPADESQPVECIPAESLIEAACPADPEQAECPSGAVCQ